MNTEMNSKKGVSLLMIGFTINLQISNKEVAILQEIIINKEI
jgi:hypothetical protein